MPASYVGSDAIIGTREAPTISVPVDADTPNAASVVTPLEKLADYVAHLQHDAAMLDYRNIFSVPQAAVNMFGAINLLVGSTAECDLVPFGLWWSAILAGDTGANPSATHPVTNMLLAKNTAKTWAQLYLHSGAITVVDGFNIGLVTLENSGYDIEVNFPTNGHMASGAYAVVANVTDCTVASVLVACAFQGSKTAAKFRFHCKNAAGAAVDLTGAAAYIDFVVFGQQNNP